MKKKLLIGFIIVFIAAQFFQPTKNEGITSSPQDITRAVTVPEEVFTILQRSCYDCHSNHTSYPWYDRISPVSWWVANHIKEGKIELNFTEFGNYSAKKQLKKLKEIRETVEQDEMPLSSYLVMHRDARLSNTQKSMLINWTKKVEPEIRQRPQ